MHELQENVARACLHARRKCILTLGHDWNQNTMIATSTTKTNIAALNIVMNICACSSWRFFSSCFFFSWFWLNSANKASCLFFLIVFLIFPLFSCIVGRATQIKFVQPVMLHHWGERATCISESHAVEEAFSLPFGIPRYRSKQIVYKRAKPSSLCTWVRLPGLPRSSLCLRCCLQTCRTSIWNRQYSNKRLPGNN